MNISPKYKYSVSLISNNRTEEAISVNPSPYSVLS